MADTILIVDDEPNTLELLQLTLTKVGYTVLTAGSGTEALQVSAARHPDLIVLDLMMPDISGLDVIRELKKHYAKPPVIVFTARGRIEDMVAGMEAGAFRYLIKPTSRDKLLETIRDALAELKPPTHHPL
jgi:two-component system OmpR family response regulator